MNAPIIRAMTQEDSSSVISLNAAFEEATSPMDDEKFSYLFSLCDLKLVMQLNGEVVGFILGVADRDYDNGNYRWFSDRLKRFLYIDRVVISDVCQGLGVGRLVYSQIIEWARQSELLTICAEMNLDPPNHQSIRFHQKQGFLQIGTRLLESGKLVSMQIRPTEENRLSTVKEST